MILRCNIIPEKVQQIIVIIQDWYLILVSIVVSIPACHAGDRGSIPRRGGNFLIFGYEIFVYILNE